MAKTFDCPKCGAPIDEADINHDNDASVVCKYCGKTVIVPPELRHQSNDPVIIQTVQVVDSRPPVRRNSGLSCAVFLVIMVITAGVLISVFTTNTTNSLMSSIQGMVPGIPGISTPAPTATDIYSAVQTQLAPMNVQLTKAFEQIETKIPRATPTQANTPTPRGTPTPKANLTATAAVQALTLAAQAKTLTQQRAWPIVLEEKFTNASRGWTTGIDNGNLAQENLAIAGGKYIWIFTTKKSMGSFSFPTMPEQTDMYISVDMQMISTTGNMEDQGGITFRQSEADQSFYFFSVNSNGSYSLTMYDGSGWDTLIETSDTNLLKANQVNHLGVSIQGSTILLEINGKVVDSFEDSRLSAGVAGLGLHLPAAKEDATVIFSNFTVRAPKK